MDEKNIKIFFSLLILFVIDLIRPFGYTLNTEFLFLGVVFLSFNYPLFPALILSVVFGYFKDCVSSFGAPINTIEFPVLCALIHYALSYLSPLAKSANKMLAKIFIFFGACIIHLAINALLIDNFLLLFSVFFLLQSFLFFLFISYLLKKWVNIQSIEYI